MREMEMFLTEYSDWLSFGMGLLVIILLAITLHKMKRMERELHRQREQMKTYFEERKKEEENKPTVMVEEPVYERKKVAKEAPENLINAVLEEIFP